MKRMKRIVLAVVLGLCTVNSGYSRGVSAEKAVLGLKPSGNATTADPADLGSSLSGTRSSKGSVKKKTAILVDKKTNKLYLTEYRDGAYQVIKEYHATLGQVKGDKEEEGDLKTPEGIYTFSQHLTPPALKPKFGDMAFYINYPNTYDDLAGRKGFDIMLHATNDPARLVESYDSLGCVVVKNEEIREIKPAIRLGLTPILIFRSSPTSSGGRARIQRSRRFSKAG